MKSSSASNFLKHVISVLSSVTKSKSMAIKSKAEALKARLVVFSLLKSKRLPLAAAISHKVHAILGVGPPQQHYGDDIKANQSLPSSSHVDHHKADDDDDDDDDYCNNYYYYYYNNDNDDHDYGNDGKYPDLRHSLFEEEEDELDLGDPNASVIDLVKNSKEQDGEDFSLEDEINHVADLFITKFHKRMKLQKLESFKRYQDMLARGAA